VNVAEYFIISADTHPALYYMFHIQQWLDICCTCTFIQAPGCIQNYNQEYTHIEVNTDSCHFTKSNSTGTIRGMAAGDPSGVKISGEWNMYLLL